MKKELLLKSLALGIVVLFIGVSFQPVYATDFSLSNKLYFKNEINKNELVELTVQICELEKECNYTVLLTQEQFEELNVLINNFKIDLDKVSTIEETVVIYNDMIISLDKLGIIPDNLNIEETQQLVTYQYLKYSLFKENQVELINFLNKIQNSNYKKTQKLFTLFYQNPDLDNLDISEQIDVKKNESALNNRNYVCLVSGRTNYTLCVHRFNPIFLVAAWAWVWYAASLGLKIFEKFPNLPDLMFIICFCLWIGVFVVLAYIWGITLNITDKNPFALFNIFGIGYFYVYNIHYSEGWVNSIGLLGLKKWEGELIGNLPGSKLYIDPYLFISIYPAVWGFNGIKIWLNEDGSEKFYLGSALAVGLDEKI
jgi:hypothetical protein